MSSTGPYEAELEQIRGLEDWRIPKAASLRTALTSLDRALGTVLDSSAWEGSSAEAARKSLSTLQQNFRIIEKYVGQLAEAIDSANTYRRNAASAELPSARVDPFWANAAKVGSVVVHPVLGPLAADKALDVIGGFLGNQREEEAKRIVQKIEQDLAPSADSLRSASATLADFDPRVAMPTPPQKPVPPGTSIDAPQITYPGGGSSPSGPVPGGGGQQPSTPTFPTHPGGGGGTGGLNPGGWEPTYPGGWEPTYPGGGEPTFPGGWEPTYPGGVEGADPDDGSGSGDDDPTVDFPGGGVLPGSPVGTGGGGYPGGSGGPGSGSVPGGSLPGAFIPGGGGGLGGAVGGGAGAAAIAASSKIAAVGSMGGIGGSASGAGLKAGGGLLGNSAPGGAGGTGTGGTARGGVGGVGGTSGAGSGSSGSAGAGSSGAAGGRPGMGMMGAGGADEEDKAKRSGLGGPIAPKLEDEEERGPRAKSAQAGSRDEHTD